MERGEGGREEEGRGIKWGRDGVRGEGSREGVVVVVAPIRGGEEEGARRRRELVRGTGLT